jgi:hypothetical protein
MEVIKYMPNRHTPWLGQGRRIEYMKHYLCIEDGETFITEALDADDARENAAIWNGQVIRELDEEESVKHLSDDGKSYYKLKGNQDG